MTVAIDWGLFFIAMDFYSTCELNIRNFLPLLGSIIIYSNVNSAQFAIAHELMHKSGWRRILGIFIIDLGTLHQIKTLNMHFTYEHVFGHHRRVSTP